MRNSTKIWLIAASSLVFLGILIFVGVMMFFKWDFKKLSIRSYNTNTYETSEDFNSISINTNEADVIFIPSNDGQCKVVCYEREKMPHLINVIDGTLNIEIDDTRRWYDHIGIFSFGHPMITVYLPNAEYDSLTVKSSTGDVGIPKDFRFNNVDVSLSTGNVRFLSCSLGDVKLKTSTGSISAENISVGSLDLSVTSGDIYASNVTCEGDVNIRVSTGDADLSEISCKNFTSYGNTGEIELNGVVVAEKMSVERSTGDVGLYGCDASEIFIKTDTGDVEGTLLSDKIFITHTDTGRVKVPSTLLGGKCEIYTDTGNILFEIESN